MEREEAWMDEGSDIQPPVVEAFNLRSLGSSSQSQGLSPSHESWFDS
jgi:hypothetical protein